MRSTGFTLAAGPGAQSTTLAYDAIGNLQSKTGVGSYTYHPTRRHAVTSAGGVSYGYDANGNMTSRGGATIGWSSYNLPTTINAPGGYSAQFAYAPDRSRWRQVSTYAGGTETTIYVGGLLEKLTTPARTHWKHLIATPSGQVQVIRRSDGTSETLYVTTDHLGSTDAVLDAAGNAVLRGSFAVHGERRASNWQGPPSSGEWQSIANTTRRGYTGHEMLDNVALIHMNGRVLDPALGRFLSADPYIDGPLSTQGWNRYAYVQGRAMSATDPSGYILCRPVCANNGFHPPGFWDDVWAWLNSLESQLETIEVTARRDPFAPTWVSLIDDIHGLPNPLVGLGEGSEVLEEVVVTASAETDAAPQSPSGVQCTIEAPFVYAESKMGAFGEAKISTPLGKFHVNLDLVSLNQSTTGENYLSQGANVEFRVFKWEIGLGINRNAPVDARSTGRPNWQPARVLPGFKDLSLSKDGLDWSVGGGLFIGFNAGTSPIKCGALGK